jgi:hypothetical protein
MTEKLRVLESQGTVTQDDLENLLQLAAQIEQLERTRDRIAAGVLARVLAGGPVEPGPRSCWIDESTHGATRRQKLVVR